MLALVAVAVMQSSVWAGGNNGKNKLKIRVTNDSDSLAGVIVDPPSSLDFQDEDEFRDAGGRILEPGASTEFRVKSGNHNVAAALIDEFGDPGNVVVRRVTKARKEARLTIDEDGGDTTLTINSER